MSTWMRMMSRITCGMALFIVVLLLGCGKAIVPFEIMEQQELVINYGVDGSSSTALEAEIAKLDYVQLVQSGLADRVLAGKAGADEIAISLEYGNGGGKILSVTADSVVTCVDKLRPSLMTQYVLKTLSRAQAKNQPFHIEVRTDRNSDEPYHATEFIQFQVKSEKQCYLLLLELAPNGKVNILYPNAYVEAASVEAGKWYEFGRENSPFRIQIDRYTGESVVWAVGHEDQSLDLEQLTGHSVSDAEGYITLSHEESAQFLQKLFPVIFPSRAVVLGKPWATSFTVYRIE